MTYSRRFFLKGMAALSTTSLLAPSVLTSSKALAASAKAGAAPLAADGDFSGWKITGSHFGAIRAKVVNDRVVEVRPFE